MKILLISYALSPSRGSEPAIGWGWASGLAQVHDLTVVSRASNRNEVESFLKVNPEITMKLQWVESGGANGPISGACAYSIWMRRVVKLCRVLCAKQQFDLVQLVSYGTISASTDLWDLGVPFVLGPVGGGQRLNPMYQQVLGPMSLESKLRNLRIHLLPYWPSIRKMIRKTSLILAGNRETESIVRRIGGKTAIFCDTGVKQEFLLDEAPMKRRLSGLRMLWTGRMLYRKAVPIVFHAMRLAGREDFVLDLVGTGPMEQSWRAAARELGIEKQVTFHGKVPFARVFDFYDKADLFVFPSVNEAFGSQLLEAACRGLPILTLNHQGAGALVPDSVAWKVPVDSVENTIAGMAEAMSTLADDQVRLTTMSRAAIVYATTESWPKRIDRASALFARILSEKSNGGSERSVYLALGR